jgi:DNA polymerase-3 subunit gamma/tau
MWPEVLNRLREIKRTPWSLISQESAAVDMVDGVLTLAFKQPTLRDTFLRREDFQANLRQAISDVLGLDVRFEAIVDPSAEPSGSSGGVSQPRVHNREQGPSAGPPDGEQSSNPPARNTSAAAASARAEIRATANGSQASAADLGPSDPGSDAPDDDVDPDDRDLDDSGLSERELLEQTLGAKVIDEIDHN